MKFIKKYKKCLFAFIAIVIIVFSSMISVFANGVIGPSGSGSHGSLSCPPLIFDAHINNTYVPTNIINSHFTISDVATNNATVDYYSTGYNSDISLLNINDSFYQVDNTLKPVFRSHLISDSVNQWAGTISYQHLVSYATRGSQVTETPSSIFYPDSLVLSVNDFYSWSGFADDTLELDNEYLSSGSEFGIQFFNLDPNTTLMPTRLELRVKQLGTDIVYTVSILAEDFEELGITDYNFKFDYPFWFRTLTSIDESLPFVFHVYDCSFHFINIPTLDPNYADKFQISFKSSYDFDPRFTGLYDLGFDYLEPDPSVPVYPDEFPLMPFANWLGGAVSGFLDLQLFPGFTLGGVFVTIFAFTCVVWFLKLVAGG